MDSANRRGFLKVAGAGAAAAGAASLIPLSVGTVAGVAGVAAPARAANLPAAAKGSIAAYIHDVSTGEIAVMVEGHEVTITDHELVARLAIALHTAPATSA
ncbi:anaerobic selenocysteine-containing dehydrogenase [Nakamurella sp. UYEF19]|uniref:twin-arginine translocation signal domain-containing protein n=1 Tax=Nakamurella sp. UYEF19 TaxID=1756392 RepID=UPI003397A0F8